MKMENKPKQPEILHTAVLFIIFNRIETTKQVFEAIRNAKPPRLYIAADGPRPNKDHEAEKVEAVRNQILENIDWQCEIKTLFREKNLGCKKAVSEAITWFFNNEEQGIILEDDCLPSQSFFWFCEDLLGRYKNDLRIWHISGDNFQNGHARGKGSYYFSKFVHVWGWASWADRWEKYDANLSDYEDFKLQKLIKNTTDSKKEKRYWQKIFENVSNGNIDTWDYQWTFTVWVNNALSILPNVNLISNIGFGTDATHTTDLDSQHSKIPREEIYLPIEHPKFLLRNIEADDYTIKQLFKEEKIITKILNKLLQVFRDEL